MDLLRQDGSPYINDMDFSDPSAQHTTTISPHTSPFDQFEFASLQGAPFPHTPSYNGSYHNSPFSGHSELSFGGGEGEQFSLFDEEPSVLDYDPAEYDPPSTGGLLMFDSEFMEDQNNPNLSVSVVPAQLDYSSSKTFDYSSPSSGADSNPEPQSRSRGSSVSSNPHKSSPRLDVTQGFEKMRFDSPNWGTRPLPVDRSMSPPHKPQSPPQLMIPGSPSGNMYPQSPPVINAPDGDGGLMGEGPQLHIVPATPISGGGGTSQPVPFQTSLETLHQGSSTGQQRTVSGWDQRSQQLQQSEVSQYPDQAQPFHFPGHSHIHSHIGDIRRLSSSNAQVQANSNGSYLYPFPPRSRSLSDTDLRPPQWANMSQDQMSSNVNGSAFDDDNAATVNLSDILPSQQHTSSAGAHQQPFGNLDSMQSPPMQQQFNFGSANSTNNFLSPDMGAQLRRSKSDGASRPGHQRQSRSEDMRHSGNMLYPDTAHQDFMTRQYLHPQESIPFRASPGHHRRASSGSRGDGSWSNASSSRPSPYPSPSASPRYNPDELPNVALLGRQAPILRHQEIRELGAPLPARMEPGTVVSKPNVTTGRTANASRIRRKQEANFMCPVPGCGSTFTRSFNLKGHMRSHNEEKPFQCKWPGCGKGFARQHDCKRHEQLHSNYRPFTCDGCNKNFARMDALNRHLRSEGGAECQKTLQDSQSQQNAGQTPPLTKTEDNGWPGMSVML